MLLEGESTVNECEWPNGTSDAPVMMADFTVRRLGDISRGDQVIGWARPEVGNRRLVRSEVVAVRKRVAPLTKATLSSGSTIVSESGQRWAVSDSHRGGGPYFRELKEPRRVLRLFEIPPPLDPDLASLAGYLGGMYDGEGTRRTISQWRDVNAVTHAAIEEALVALDFPYTMHDGGFYLVGGRSHFLRFVMWCRPRKVTRGDPWVSNFHLPATMTPDEIICVEDAGVGEVIDLQTVTGNYTAWGIGAQAIDLGVPVRSLN
jgi:hypothetical protein